ncbi:MAG TPA: nucleotide exchange factor GrpE [Blastocatellia bacterium]|nr:nucleotide exchange factor GrpE [Blastocatellia bacterium]
MTNKKDEPKEIPVQFINEGEDAQAEETDDPAPESVSDDGGADADEEIQPDPLAALQSQVETLTQERSVLYDQLLRRQAEFENYRRRVERERGETYTRARAEVLLELLPVIDNFERALASLENSTGDAESLRHGVELIHKQFQDALTKFGLEPVESVGQAFDPHLHEAVTIEPTDKHKENTVIEEFQRGYKLGEKLLRPAKVKVASSPER